MGLGSSKMVSLAADRLGTLIVLAQATRLQERGRPWGTPGRGRLELESHSPGHKKEMGLWGRPTELDQV